MQDRNGAFGFDESSQCRQSRFAQSASHPGTVVDAVAPDLSGASRDCGASQKEGPTEYGKRRCNGMHDRPPHSPRMLASR